MTCPSGHDNPEGEEFCVTCGVQLAASPPPTDPPSAESPPDDHQQPPDDTPAPPPTPLDPLAEEEMKFHSSPTYPITLSLAGATHEGLHGVTAKGLSGKNNEDAFVVDGVDFPKHNIAVRMLVVADGMGGEQAGEVLSKQAVYDIAAGLWFLTPSWEQHMDFGKLDFWRFTNSQFSRFLSNQVAVANSRVVRYGRAKKFKAGHYGATVAVSVAAFDQELGRVAIHGFSNGDARAYLVLDGKITQLSVDQTVMNCPTTFLGAHDHLTGKPFGYEAWLSDEQIQTGWLLLCSDGFWNMLSPDAIAEICEGCKTAEQATAELIETSLCMEIPYGRAFDERVQTGDDNITLAVLKFSRKEITQ